MVVIVPVGVCLLSIAAFSTAVRRLRYLELNPVGLVLLFFCFIDTILLVMAPVELFGSSKLYALFRLVPVVLIVAFFVFLYHCPKVATEERSDTETYGLLIAALSGTFLLMLSQASIVITLWMLPVIGEYLAAVVAPILRLPYMLGLGPRNVVLYGIIVFVLLAVHIASLYAVVKMRESPEGSGGGPDVSRTTRTSGHGIQSASPPVFGRRV